MQDLKGRIALITGGASGIGLAMAHRFAREGMRLVLADVEGGALEKASAEILSGGTEVLSVLADVGDPDQMDQLAARVREEFGPIQIACLNAGVSGGGGPIETLTTEDWAWGIHVNLWGVIHGLRVFLSDMKARDAGHIVITSSIAGLTCFPSAGPYHATKHAVAGIAETLYHELAEAGSKVGVSCLCPGLVSTNFPTGDRNRPASLLNPTDPNVTEEQIATLRKAVGDVFARGATPEHVADCVFEAIAAGRFWIYTDSIHEKLIRDRHRAIEAGKNPPQGAGALDGY